MESTEWLVVIVSSIHVMMAPGTKVEESFNVQATHDLLFHSWTNLTQFDHYDFPGVVPRTFLGPMFLAFLTAPMSFIFRYWMVPKLWQLILIRGTLGLLNTKALLSFAQAVKRSYGKDTANFLRLIMCTQFHYLYYCSRPLPNSFAMIFVMLVLERIIDNRIESACRWATAAVFLFRIELVLFFGPLFIQYIFTGRLPLRGQDGAIANGLRTAAYCLVASVIVDSYFWGRPIWPEGEVALFNVVENRSHEYGTHPFLWYFTSAMPRALLLTIFLVPLGNLVDPRVPYFLFPAGIFVFLYSFLPHKELRFIIYVFPLFSLSAAFFCARIYINRWKSWIHKLVYIAIILHLIANLMCTGVFLTVAARNYPGFDAINQLHIVARHDSRKPRSVYIDNACAQTGFSRFNEQNEAWTYNKTENLKPEDLKNFDFLLLGTYGSNLVETVENKYMKYHSPMYFVNGFHKYNLVRSRKFPYIYPTVEYKEKAVIMKNKNYP